MLWLRASDALASSSFVSRDGFHGLRIAPPEFENPGLLRPLGDCPGFLVFRW